MQRRHAKMHFTVNKTKQKIDFLVQNGILSLFSDKRRNFLVQNGMFLIKLFSKWSVLAQPEVFTQHGQRQS